MANGRSGRPRPSANLRGCDYDGRTLVGVDFHASTLTDASFVSANLCGATLSTATLRRADFTGANLINANLRSSACDGAIFTNAVFCNTIDCTGNRRDDPGCPSRPCCTDAECHPGEICTHGGCRCRGCSGRDGCRDGDRWDQCGHGGETCQACAAGSVCAADSHSCQSCASQTGLTACDGWVSPAGPTPGAQCGPPVCACAERATGGGSFCWGSPVHCNIPGLPCTTPEGACPGNLVCVRKGSCPLLDACPGDTVCVPACQASTPGAAGLVEVVQPT